MIRSTVILLRLYCGHDAATGNRTQGTPIIKRSMLLLHHVGLFALGVRKKSQNINKMEGTKMAGGNDPTRPRLKRTISRKLTSKLHRELRTRHFRVPFFANFTLLLPPRPLDLIPDVISKRVPSVSPDRSALEA